MNLKSIVEQLFLDSIKTPIRGLSAISEAENYLQQAYEGRYFFELIQNVRDANKENNQDGSIYIELKDKNLFISNTGAEFSPKGIEGITTIGQSTKKSQDYIGFKGIGFKSIQEITHTPKIVTCYGSIEFNRNLTLLAYDKSEIELSQIPLFYFPHYDETSITDEEKERSIVTRIELPLRDDIDPKRIIEDFKQIHVRQLVMLGHIKELKFITDNRIIKYEISSKPNNYLLEVIKDDSETIKFKKFTPHKKVILPDEVINELNGKEKEIFTKNPQIDISIVFE